MRRGVTVLVGLLAVVTVAGFLDRVSWVFEPATVFRLQHAVLLLAAAGLAAFVFGVTLLASPGKSLQAVVTLVGIYLLVFGGLRLVHAAEASRESRASGV